MILYAVLATFLVMFHAAITAYPTEDNLEMRLTFFLVGGLGAAGTLYAIGTHYA